MRCRSGQKLLGFLLGVIVALQAPVAHARGADDVSLLVWKVTAPGGRTPDYVAGVYHPPVPLNQRLPATVRKLIADSDLFIGEIDTTLSPAAALKRWAKLPDGQRNSERLPKEVWQRILKEAGRLGIPEAVVDVIAPWFLCSIMATKGAKPAQLRDVMLHQAARQHRLETEFLENLDEQYELLASLPIAEYDALLAKEGCGKQDFSAILALYDKADIAGLTQMFVPPEGVRQAPEQYERTYFRRNRAWLPRLMQAINGRRAFIAVGIGHLLGDKGLLAELKAKGYKVEFLPL